jgi:hypothetical protein
MRIQDCELAFEKDSADDASISSKSRSVSDMTSTTNASTRSSISSIASRLSYGKDLADPNRHTAFTPLPPRTKARHIDLPPLPPRTSSSKVKNVLATSQCHLCPKTFTRAIDLGSHLHTHSEEGPFDCNLCSMAFTRQRERELHQCLQPSKIGLVCGSMSGTMWGCGRRFADPDKLGRHFRSPAGQVCLKPLLDIAGIPRNLAER